MANERKKKRKAKFTNKMNYKMLFVFAVILVCLAGLNIKISKINAADGEEYTKKVLEQQQYDSRVIPYKRGDIQDRNGTKIAISEKVYNVILDAKVLLTEKRYKKPTLNALKKYFDIDKGEVEQQLKDKPNSRYIVLKKGVPHSANKNFLDAMAKNSNINGVWMEDNYVRKYPYKTLASGLIGFTADGNVGNWGIEGYYNSKLNGVDGREYGYWNDDAELERTVKEAQNGKNIVSTIDVNLQSIVEKYIQEFQDTHKNEVRPGDGSDHTAVLIMDPKTGEILANASTPFYDLNNPRDLSVFYTEEEIAAMDDAAKVENLNKNIWRNFSISSVYEPGSTVKPFTVAAGLESGKLTGGEIYDCVGMLTVGDHDISCNNHAGHGVQTVEQSLMNSCNVALMQMGMTIGPDIFTKYQGIFGFGQKTNVDLPGEEYGLIYTADKMRITDLATNAFGQNFNTTMVQVGSAFCSLINGGNYYQPHVVKQILDDEGNVVESKEPMLLKQTVSASTSETLKQYLYHTVQEGTGKAAQVPGYAIGGKTGTAEKQPRDKKDYLVSFIGFAPVENPQIMIYTVVDRPNVAKQDSSGLAIEIAQKIMTEALPYMNIFPEQ